MVKLTNKEIHEWIDQRNKEIGVQLETISLDECKGWSYDEESGVIKNDKGAFFSIGGICGKFEGRYIEQPIFLQPEIGFLGYVCAVVDGELMLLVQTKLEPGNINLVQIAPTMQATKSNYERKHGGRMPVYLDMFMNAEGRDILVDQLQSEQGSRFWRKRNSNIILITDKPDEIELTVNHKWISISQMKELMAEDNLVNMCTRTVLSELPYRELGECAVPGNWGETMLASVMKDADEEKIKEIKHAMVAYKMFCENNIRQVPLMSLENWELSDKGFICKQDFPFKLNFNRISIEGREVQNWCQPLFEANGRALFGLMCRDHDGVRQFLVKLKAEVGCFDKVELGPTVQKEAFSAGDKDEIEQLMDDRLESGEGILFDVILAEEGGRFYHEGNRNVVMLISDDEIDSLPDGYFWCDYSTLAEMNGYSHNINIQLRSLMSVL